MGLDSGRPGGPADGGLTGRVSNAKRTDHRRSRAARPSPADLSLDRRAWRRVLDEQLRGRPGEVPQPGEQRPSVLTCIAPRFAVAALNAAMKGSDSARFGG